MTPGRLVRINRADVTCEVFDDEVVLINFRSGSYFSVGGFGREIVQELAGRDATVGELVRLVETCFTGEASSMTSATEAFLADLERADLVTVTDGEAPEPSADPASESKAEDVLGRRPHPLPMPSVERTTAVCAFPMRPSRSPGCRTPDICTCAVAQESIPRFILRRSAPNLGSLRMPS